MLLRPSKASACLPESTRLAHISVNITSISLQHLALEATVTAGTEQGHGRKNAGGRDIYFSFFFLILLFYHQIAVVMCSSAVRHNSHHLALLTNTVPPIRWYRSYIRVEAIRFRSLPQEATPTRIQSRIGAILQWILDLQSEQSDNIRHLSPTKEC